MDLFDAIRERRERAVQVRESYDIEHAGAQCWVVLHPDEPERCYLVDMLARHCSCPDWSCTAAGLGIDCKHIIAVAPFWERLTGRTFERQERPLRPSDPLDIAFSMRMAEAATEDPYQTL